MIEKSRIDKSQSAEKASKAISARDNENQISRSEKAANMASAREDHNDDAARRKASAAAGSTLCRGKQ